MFNCKDSIDLLVGYLDGELDGDVRQKLEAHFGGCAACEEFLKTYRATPTLCRCALKKQMPQEVADKLTDFLRQHIGRK